MKSLLVVVITLMFFGTEVRAENFVVISNADSGPGTLREAIEKSTANGTLLKDVILFDLQNPVIELLSSLPPLSTNLDIDGSNQGRRLGVSDAGVSILKSKTLAANIHIDIFTGNNLLLVNIYSIHFPRLEDGKLTSTPIYFSNSSQVTIGGTEGKGNVFGALELDLKMLSCRSVRILSNWFGLTPNKTPEVQVASNSALQLYACNSISLGGADPKEGNIFVGRYSGPQIVGNDPSSGSPTTVLLTGDLCIVRNNIFGVEGNASVSGFTSPFSIRNQRNAFIVENKSYLSAGFDVRAITETLTVLGNKLGLIGSPTRHLNMIDVNRAVIGGTQPGDANTFINATTSGSIYAEVCGDVSILGNTAYCLENGLIYFSERSKVTIPVIKISNISNGMIRGTATSNADIEVFSDGTCNKCEAGAVSSRTRSDAQGNWEAAPPAGNGFTASATLNNRTSQFAMIGNDFTGAQTINPTCGKNNGSIRGIVVQNGTSMRWVNSRGEVVGTANDLINVPAGIYTLTSYMGACASKPQVYVLNDAGIDIKEDKVSAMNTSCGLDNGSITGLQINNTGATIKSIEWRNERNEIKGIAADISKIPPGIYTLYITTDNNCVVTSRPYTILASEPLVDRTQERVINAQCGDPTGRLTGPGISAGRPPYFYEWKDENGKVLGKTQSIQNLTPGKYFLAMGDASDCGRQTFEYQVGSNPGVVAAPQLKDVQICAAGEALIQVQNPSKGTYILYNENGVELSRNEKGTFLTMADDDTKFFVSFRGGSCESEKATVMVRLMTGAFSKTNTITPNGDGINDRWEIPALSSYPQAVIQIYNRFGQSIYKSIGYQSPFDGRRDGRELPAGTYYYVINLRKGCTIVKGALTLLR